MYEFHHILSGNSDVKIRCIDSFDMYTQGVKVLNLMITPERVQIVDSQTDWQAAVNTVCAPLLKEGCIEPSYIQAIIKTTHDIGPYYVLAPNIAMPHARPEDGVISNGLALLVVKEGVSFNSKENDPVKILLLLAARDSEQHIELIQSISSLFCCDNDVNDIINANDVSDVINVIKKY
jgi:ascorbate PTS system EIIA or EIIAB component